MQPYNTYKQCAAIVGYYSCIIHNPAIILRKLICHLAHVAGFWIDARYYGVTHLGSSLLTATSSNHAIIEIAMLEWYNYSKYTVAIYFGRLILELYSEGICLAWVAALYWSDTWHVAQGAAAAQFTGVIRDMWLLYWSDCHWSDSHWSDKRPPGPP